MSKQEANMVAAALNLAEAEGWEITLSRGRVHMDNGTGETYDITLNMRGDPRVAERWIVRPVDN